MREYERNKDDYSKYMFRVIFTEYMKHTIRNQFLEFLQNHPGHHHHHHFTYDNPSFLIGITSI